MVIIAMKAATWRRAYGDICDIGVIEIRRATLTSGDRRQCGAASPRPPKRQAAAASHSFCGAAERAAKASKARRRRLLDSLGVKIARATKEARLRIAASAGREQQHLRAAYEEIKIVDSET